MSDPRGCVPIVGSKPPVTGLELLTLAAMSVTAVSALTAAAFAVV